MTNPLTTSINSTDSQYCQDTPPIVKQLLALFRTIPEEELLKALKPYYAGRLGYTNKVLWRSYLAMTMLNVPSFAALTRTLETNPFVAG